MIRIEFLTKGFVSIHGGWVIEWKSSIKITTLDFTTKAKCLLHGMLQIGYLDLEVPNKT